MKEKELREIETDLLLDGILRRYGYDFRQYARASLNRRVSGLMSQLDISHVSALLPRVLREETVFNDFLKAMSVSVTEMFRDPDVYTALREVVLPYLRTYPFIRIWHAGCSTGEEVYSMAIMLEQEGLSGRVQIYATDLNNELLDFAKKGVYDLRHMKKYMKNYNNASPHGSFSDYYVTNDNSAIMVDTLKKHIVFANHNLVTDSVFGEMNLILCRNVLIYFDRNLQNRVLRLFRDSLAHRGFLCLGAKESIEFSDVGHEFETISRSARIFQKRGVVKVGSRERHRTDD